MFQLICNQLGCSHSGCSQLRYSQLSCSHGGHHMPARLWLPVPSTICQTACPRWRRKIFLDEVMFKCLGFDEYCHIWETYICAFAFPSLPAHLVDLRIPVSQYVSNLLSFKLSLFVYLINYTPLPKTIVYTWHPQPYSISTTIHLHIFFFKQLESSAFFEEEIFEGNPCWKTGRDDRRRDEDCRGRLQRDAILMLSQVCWLPTSAE